MCSVLHSSNRTAATDSKTATTNGHESSSLLFEPTEEETAAQLSVDLPAQPEIKPATGINVEIVVPQRLKEQHQKPAASKCGGITKRGPYINTNRVEEIRKQIGEFNLHVMQDSWSFS
jgi:hypothetical protein